MWKQHTEMTGLEETPSPGLSWELFFTEGRDLGQQRARGRESGGVLGSHTETPWLVTPQQ